VGDRAVLDPEPRSLGKWRSLSVAFWAVVQLSWSCDARRQCTFRSATVI